MRTSTLTMPTAVKKSAQLPKRRQRTAKDDERQRKIFKYIK